MNVIAQMNTTVDRFCLFINALPPDALVEQDWGPKEVLAHLVYHHELYISRVEAFLSTAPILLPERRFREMNAEAVVLSRGIPPVELVERLQKANQALVQLYGQHDPSQIPVQIKAGGKVWTLAELLPRVEAHIRNHLARLTVV